MLRKAVMWVVAVSLLAGLTNSARADEISDLRQQLEQQMQQMQKMQKKLAELEAAQKQQDTVIQEQATLVQKLEQNGTLTVPETLKWAEKISLNGDFRYRFQWEDTSGRDRTRHRIRARVGLKARINDEMTFDLRVASGGFGDAFDEGGDPLSANQTLDTYWSSKDLWLDRAYLTWKPACINGLTVFAGKMSNPFYSVGKNELIWDHDANPEGIAFGYKTGDLFVNGGVMSVEENGSSSDLYLWGAQIGLVHAFANDSKAIIGASYYDYMDIQGQSPDLGVLSGNTDGGGTTYAYDYDLVELFGGYDTKLNGTPFSAFGNYVVNTASGVTGDTGWLLGCTYGKAKKPGTWAVRYNYRDLDSDAVVGAFSDSDINGGGTGLQGHEIGFDYALMENTVAGLSYFCSQNQSDNAAKHILQFDVKVKF